MTTLPIIKKIGDLDLDRRRASQLLLGAAAAAALPIGFATEASAQASAARIKEMMTAGPNGDRLLGDKDAKVTIIEYASMTCPHCARFHGAVLPELKKKYIDTGKANYIFREFPLDDLALIVAMLARCVEGDTYFAFLDILFKQQRKWAAAPKAELTKLSKQVGISSEAFDKCISNQDVLNGISWERDRAKNDFDVSATPTVFVNGEKTTGSLEAISAIIDAALPS